MKQEVTPIDGFHYSTNEQFTGKYWIDGKKIYQKIISTTMPTVTVDGTSVGRSDDISSLNLDFGWVEQAITNTGSPVNGAWANIGQTGVTRFSRVGVDTINKVLYFRTNATGSSNLPIYVTIYYTKTTD